MLLHVRFEGKSFDVELTALTHQATDVEIKQTLARYLDVAAGRFRDYVVDRRPSGAVILRPEAVYG